MNIRKILISTLCLIIVAGVSVLGTMAYLQDQTEAVVNTFTMGQVNITLDETKVDEYGEPIKKVDDNGAPTEENERTAEGNEYKMIPGHTYTKDPTVTIEAGSEESYVRMFVELNCYDELQKIFDNAFLPQNFVKGWDPDVWVSTKVVDVSDDGKTATYEFRYFEKVDGVDDEGKDANIMLPALFETFEVPGEFTVEELKALEGFEIKVYAQAIQAMGFEDADGKTAEDLAWEAFDAELENNNTSGSNTQPGSGTQNPDDNTQPPADGGNNTTGA